jgi:hypothetical protein
VEFRELVIVTGAQHGVALVDAEVQSAVVVHTAIEQFLALHAPVG